MTRSSQYEGIGLDGQAVRVTLKGTKISDVESIEPTPALPRILPPLVDLQHNGALGVVYNNLSGDAADDLWKIGEYLLKHGVGRVLATFTTAPYDLLTTAAESFNVTLRSDPLLDSLFSGIFHEGVFMSPEPGWRGGHDPAYIIPPDWEKFSALNEKSGNRVKVVNVAPETPGALDFIEKAVESGVKVAMGHCNPDTRTINEAVARGASMVTHFANGMSPSIHRFKNPMWGMLDNDALSLGLIGDGFHLPPELMRVALKTKGVEHCFVVSDANAYSGCEPGPYQRLGGAPFVIEPNGFMHLVDQELLAGAWFQLDRGVETLVNEVGLSFEDAWKLCSMVPASLMGISLPKLEVGAEATFVQAYFENKKLTIKQSLFLGKEFILEEAITSS